MKSMNVKYCESIMINRRLGEAFDLMERVQDGRDGYHGLFTGIKSLDKLTNGWDPGDLVIIGGRPCSCKSTFALQMARNLAVDQDCATVYFSMTMSCAEVMNRLISAETGVPMEKLEGKVKLHIEDWNQMNASLRCLSRSPLYLDDTPGLRPSYIEERVELLSRQGMVRVVVIDDLQSVIPDFKGESLRVDRAEILRSLKEIACQKSIVVVALSGLTPCWKRNRQRPILHNLDEYCPLVTDYADRIILMDHPGLYRLDDCRADGVTLDLVRNRKGRTGSVTLILEKERIRLREFEEREFEE